MLNVAINIIYLGVETFYLHKKGHSTLLKSFSFVLVSNFLLGGLMAFAILKGYTEGLPTPSKTFLGQIIMGLISGIYHYAGKYLLARFVFKIKIDDQIEYFGLTVIAAVALLLSNFVGK